MKALPFERCDLDGNRRVRVHCLKCGTPVVLDFGQLDKAGALALLRDSNLWIRECPGFHVEFGMDHYWQVRDAIEFAYADTAATPQPAAA
jgi:hypothetical protein